MHRPFAKGVTHLMYVGDADAVPDPAAAGARMTAVNAAVAIGGIVALFGGDLGVSRSTRKVAGAVAIGALVAAAAIGK